MCGRFVLASEPGAYADYFSARIDAEALAPSFNVAPTHSVYLVLEAPAGRVMRRALWGSADGRGPGHINARSETIATKPAFAESFIRRRCLIPADGFYEWDGGGSPHWVYRADGFPMAFAGIWSQAGAQAHCTIVTGPALGVLAGIHHRAPIDLPRDRWTEWLNPSRQSPSTLAALLSPTEPSTVCTHPVSREVNNVRRNHRGLLARSGQERLWEEPPEGVEELHL